MRVLKIYFLKDIQITKEQASDMKKSANCDAICCLQAENQMPNVQYPLIEFEVINE